VHPVPGPVDASGLQDPVPSSSAHCGESLPASRRTTSRTETARSPAMSGRDLDSNRSQSRAGASEWSPRGVCGRPTANGGLISGSAVLCEPDTDRHHATLETAVDGRWPALIGPNRHRPAPCDTRRSGLLIRGRHYLRLTAPAPVFAGRGRVHSGRGPSDTHPAPIVATTGDGRPSGRNHSGCIRRDQ
jgi:hypothetical protein